MSADDVLKVVIAEGGGIEVRFNVAKLGQLTTGERENLGRKLDALVVPTIPEPTPEPAQLKATA